MMRFHFSRDLAILPRLIDYASLSPPHDAASFRRFFALLLPLLALIYCCHYYAMAAWYIGQPRRQLIRH